MKPLTRTGMVSVIIIKRRQCVGAVVGRRQIVAPVAEPGEMPIRPVEAARVDVFALGVQDAPDLARL